MNDDIQCPYCKGYFSYDGEGFDQDEEWEEECPCCEKFFIVTGSYLRLFHPSKADCLNGAEHDFKQIQGYPEEYYKGKQRCPMCGKERTVEEFKLKQGDVVK